MTREIMKEKGLDPMEYLKNLKHSPRCGGLQFNYLELNGKPLVESQANNWWYMKEGKSSTFAGESEGYRLPLDDYVKMIMFAPVGQNAEETIAKYESGDLYKEWVERTKG